MKLDIFICDKCGKRMLSTELNPSDPNHYLLTITKGHTDQKRGIVKDLCRNCVKDILGQINYEWDKK